MSRERSACLGGSARKTFFYNELRASLGSFGRKRLAEGSLLRLGLGSFRKADAWSAKPLSSWQSNRPIVRQPDSIFKEHGRQGGGEVGARHLRRARWLDNTAGARDTSWETEHRTQETEHRTQETEGGEPEGKKGKFCGRLLTLVIALVRWQDELASRTVRDLDA